MLDGDVLLLFGARLRACGDAVRQGVMLALSWHPAAVASLRSSWMVLRVLLFTLLCQW
jgi:hypothetical protein